MNDPELRLYSRGFRPRCPEDYIDPKHFHVHQQLTRWGMWNAKRSQNRSIASVEGLYTKGDTPPSTAPLSEDLAIMAIERAVIRIPTLHHDSLRMLYVQRMSSYTICRAMRLRYEAFPAWMFTARAMVLNQLRFQRA